MQVAALNESGIGSTRKSLLEQIVRVPRVSILFSIQDADALALAGNKLKTPQLEEKDFRLYDYALVTHKREGIKDFPEGLSLILEEYVQFLLRRVSGRIYANDRDFVKNYKALLSEIGLSNLPAFAQSDFHYLKVK